jgi:hypothetical protein
MKKIEWHVVQANGVSLFWDRTRKNARFDKKEYDQAIFQEWASDVVYPLKIVRKEWALVNEKVVR